MSLLSGAVGDAQSAIEVDIPKLEAALSTVITSGISQLGSSIQAILDGYTIQITFVKK